MRAQWRDVYPKADDVYGAQTGRRVAWSEADRFIKHQDCGGSLVRNKSTQLDRVEVQCINGLRYRRRRVVSLNCIYEVHAIAPRPCDTWETKRVRAG